MEFEAQYDCLPGLFPSWVYYILASAVVAVFALTLHRVMSSDLYMIPGPAIARLTHWWLKWHVISGRRVQYIHELHQTYGSVVLIAPNEVAIADVAAAREIHRAGNGYVKSDFYQKLVGGANHNVFTMVDPEEHAKRRKLLSQPFNKSAIMRVEDVVRSKVDLAVAKIKRDAEVGKADILKWFTFMATDVLGELSFGESFDMLHKEEVSQYIRDLQTSLMIAGIRAELPWIKYIPVPALQHALQLNKRLVEYATDRTQKLKTLQKKEAFFSKMLVSNEKQEISNLALAEEAGNLIIAGSDTTAISTTYLVWAIVKHPEIKQKLQSELSTLSDSFSYRDLEQLPYLGNVVEEGLRLYGAAPGSLPRVVPVGGRSLAGHFIPAGTTVSTQAFTMHRDPAIFPDPEKFAPDRWRAATKEMKEAFSPFGAGSRTCLGLNLARMELLLTTAVFLLQCPDARVSSSTTTETMDFENFFLIAPRGHKCEVTMT